MDSDEGGILEEGKLLDQELDYKVTLATVLYRVMYYQSHIKRDPSYIDTYEEAVNALQDLLHPYADIYGEASDTNVINYVEGLIEEKNKYDAAIKSGGFTDFEKKYYWNRYKLRRLLRIAVNNNFLPKKTYINIVK